MPNGYSSSCCVVHDKLIGLQTNENNTERFASSHLCRRPAYGPRPRPRPRPTGLKVACNAFMSRCIQQNSIVNFNATKKLQFLTQLMSIWTVSNVNSYVTKGNIKTSDLLIESFDGQIRRFDVPFLTDRTIGRAFGTVCLSSLCLSVCLLRHVRREWALLSFHSVCLSGCLSVIPRPTAYHDWSITTKFGRTRVSLFGSRISHTFGARGKNMQNFAYFQRQPFNAYSCHCERDASCYIWLVCLSVVCDVLYCGETVRFS